MKSGRVRLAVVGLGRIGLPTAAAFAKAGALVTGLDIDRMVVEQTNSGMSRLKDEPGLQALVKEVVSKGRLRATLDTRAAVSDANFIIISVPTPVDSSKTPDYSSIEAASRAVGKWLKRGCIVIVESTVGPGTVEDTIGKILETESRLSVGRDFGLASCPERSDPGRILSDMKSIPRVVGGCDSQTTETVAALYEEALGVKVLKVSNPKTANAVKLTENLFRDVNIALANEFAILFDKLEIDTMEVIDVCSSKYNFLPHYPGAGVGGPCLPSNSYYLISEGVKVGNIPYLIRMAREINDRMPDYVVELVSEALNEVGKTVRGSKIAVLGVAYKPDIRDVQLSPMERACIKLQSLGASLRLYDPMFKDELVFGIRTSPSTFTAVKGADCIVLGTAHTEFKKLDLRAISRLMGRGPAFVDARNMVSPEEARRAGFSFKGVGRGK